MNNAESSNFLILKGSAEDLKLLVVRRKFPPFKDMLALPGGFIKHGETALEAALRELEKETKVSLSSSSIISLSERTLQQRDPRGEVKGNFFFLYDNSLKDIVHSGEGVSESGWIKLTDLEALAFDHGAVLCEALALFWRILPITNLKKLEALENVSLPWIFSTKKLRMDDEVVFFGGSFNPWHKGHRACVELCPCDNLVVIPDFSPWKQASDQIFRCRWSTYKKIAMDLQDRPYAVYPGFWGRESANPTVSWLPETLASERSLLVGEDTYNSLLGWKNSKKVVSSLKNLYVVPRKIKDEVKTSRDEKSELLDQLKEINSSIVVEKLENHNYEDVSSTILRDKL